jgi:hypothetical protein
VSAPGTVGCLLLLSPTRRGAKTDKMERTMKTRFAVSRRQSLQGLALLGAGAAVAIDPFAAPARALEQAVKSGTIDDEDIFQFALNLEYMEAEYYLRATTGSGIKDADVGSEPGKVTGGRKVRFETKAIAEFADELAENELAHVRFYRKTLGGKAVSRPAIDFKSGFAKAAKSAGLGSDFDPFENEMNFLLGGMLFEDVGVTAYKAAAPLIQKKEFLAAAAGILAVEAYHMGMARSQLYMMGKKAREAANAISNARDKLDGGKDLDQGIVRDGKANFVPNDSNGIAFGRTPQQVLRIVYLTDKAGATSGGFYPQGMNGKLRST